MQPKGADRKHKTDREKMEKRSEAEKVSGDGFHCVGGVRMPFTPTVTALPYSFLKISSVFWKYG